MAGKLKFKETQMDSKYEDLIRLLDPIHVKMNEPMSKHTSFQIGGDADLFITPTSIASLSQVVAFCRSRNVDYYVMGNGSNLLVSDKGFRGVVIQIYKQMKHIEICGEQIRVQSGLLLSTLSKRAYNAGLTGLEFASGIPGTVGGAIYMNAGAYGGEMNHVVVEATVVNHEGVVSVLKREELELGYRHSRFHTTGEIVVEVLLQLQKGDKAVIKSKMEELDIQRKTKQPLEYPSAGSTFKRPVGYYAGQLIMEAGLSGHRIGDAMVSEKHCGFVINVGTATCEDVLNLIEFVKLNIHEKFGVDIEPEVRIIGEF
jgi:UDP-N-acetylmuramate dehydrogenase